MTISILQPVLDGLYSYEQVMLALGVMLFLTLLVVLLRLVFTGRPFVTLLGFFMVPIIMIGYPSIQSISFQNDVITIDRTTEQLKANPTNSPLRNSLKTLVARIAARPATSATSAATVGRAQLALGDEGGADINLQNALRANPKLPATQELQQRVELTQKLSSLTKQLETKPDDIAAKTALQNTVTELSSSGIANPKAITNMARAHLLLGNKTQASSFASQALAIDPKSVSAQQVQNKVKATEMVR
jgi:hypothetical protein